MLGFFGTTGIIQVLFEEYMKLFRWFQGSIFTANTELRKNILSLLTKN